MVTSKQEEKITLSFDPYTFVRVSVMRSMLLKRQDYHRFMKMSVPEITKYLQDNDYSDDISSLATKYSGTELAELALGKNIERRFSKLRRVCDQNLKILVDAYLKRHDLHNIKTALRAKNMKLNSPEALDMMIFAGTLGREFYQELLKEDNIQNILKKVSEKGFLPHSINTTEKFSDTKMLHIENMLDKEYYSSLGRLAERIPIEGDILRNFIKYEIEHMNILMILRLKREKLSREQIMQFLFFPSGLLKQSKFSQLLELDLNQIIEHVNKTYHIKSGVTEFQETGSLIPIERELTKSLLNRSRKMGHKNLLSVDTILNYLFAKEVEIRNLRMLIKGKTLLLEDNFIEKGLVI